MTVDNYTYDTGKPDADQDYHLVTKTVTTPVALDGTTVPTADIKTTVTGYDPIDGTSSTDDTSGWVLGEPTTETTWMGTSASSTNDLTTLTRYDSAGNVVESRLPGGTATSANTTVTTYYTAATNTTYSSCGDKPYWAGQVCRTDPGGSPSAGYATLSTTYTYNLYGETTKLTETSGSVSRTTTTTFDAIGRPTSNKVVVSGLSSSTALPETTTTYDASTGLPLTITNGTATLTSTYDALGRQITYTDADSTTTTHTYNIDGQVASYNDGQATTTYAYDSTSEHRGLVTSLNTGMGNGLSTFTATYDTAGQLASQTYPNGMTATYSHDNLGTTTSLIYALPTYAAGTAGTLTFTNIIGALGDVVHSQSPLSAQDYTYDNAGRLLQVNDTVDGSCGSRVYAYTKQSDRSSITTYGGDSSGGCQTTTSTATSSDTYDTANRTTTSGYSYDQLGRTLTVPAASLASGANTVTAAYYDNDKPVSLTQGTAKESFTLDPQGRYRQTVNSTSGSETKRTIEHYAGNSDSPSWTATSTDIGASYTWQRNVAGINGQLAAIQSSDGSSSLQLTNLHGDVVATVPNQVPTAANTAGSSTSAYFESTEFGTPRDTSTTQRYGWLGGQQRSSDAIGSLMLMGARVYNPYTGRFLQVDPVAGGTENAYVYPTDPVNSSDTSGRMAEVVLGAGVIEEFPPIAAATIIIIVGILAVFATVCLVRQPPFASWPGNTLG
ncbi:RHS repeat-associated core domain-containing protein [Actinoplanes sp. NPDC051851]|uniref:RHS repeat-associated core domain-containing protein n=1 Tax=Actinoplanes sp. NPDC051851 TaxID=3154753 RepID=UPI003413E1E5